MCVPLARSPEQGRPFPDHCRKVPNHAALALAAGRTPAPAVVLVRPAVHVFSVPSPHRAVLVVLDSACPVAIELPMPRGEDLKLFTCNNRAESCRVRAGPASLSRHCERASLSAHKHRRSGALFSRAMPGLGLGASRLVSHPIARFSPDAQNEPVMPVTSAFPLVYARPSPSPLPFQVYESLCPQYPLSAR